MRFLGIGEYNDLAALYQGLAARGHEVRVFVEEEGCRDVFAGMLDFSTDWQDDLAWVREGEQSGGGGVVLFESAVRGAMQDALRHDGYRVIGGSALGDRLEADREYGQQVLRQAGMHTAASHAFDDYAAAHDFVKAHPGRYVLKFNGAGSERTRNFVGEMADGRDMLALLSLYQAQHHAPHAQHAQHAPHEEPARPDFVLMEHLQGVEVGVGAYFNGREFLRPVCMDFEHKRFFHGELGELTGEMGTIVTYRGGRKLFEAALAPVAPLLAESGYCGYINVNLIANARGLWPLEFTSRFGYPGFAICEALHLSPWEDIFTAMLRKSSLEFGTREGYASGVVLTVPPFPYRHGYEALSKGAPVCLRDEMTPQQHACLHFAEVARVNGQLVTAGTCGYVGVATGIGADVKKANANALAVARNVVVPNLRYRTDIGERVSGHDLVELGKLGLLSAD